MRWYVKVAIGVAVMVPAIGQAMTVGTFLTKAHSLEATGMLA